MLPIARKFLIYMSFFIIASYLATTITAENTTKDKNTDSASTAELVKNMNFKLQNGVSMPAIGFGTYQIRGYDLIKEVLDYALAAGYRLIDTAKVYRNEEEIGKALKELLPKYNLTRKDIWITTKLPPSDQGAAAYATIEQSLKKLDCEYIDLYLIHWPGSNLTAGDPKNSQLRDESWKQLVKAVNDGLVKNIGVSNYLVKHLKELLANDHGIRPVVNQVEWHLSNHPQDLLDYCRQENILIQAYSSLGGTGNTNLINNDKVKAVAMKLRRTPAQILLRWALQQDLAIIPKARSKKHIEENIDLNFIIPDEDMTTLNDFKVEKFAWDPETIA